MDVPSELPSGEEVFKDTVAVLRSSRTSSDETFLELLLQFDYAELLGLIACLAEMLNSSIDLGNEYDGSTPDEIYNLLLEGCK